jgi:hypothetical protein
MLVKTLYCISVSRCERPLGTGRREGSALHRSCSLSPWQSREDESDYRNDLKVEMI